ncbi:hypothetical protein B0T17DRAFT_631592, partial [Bombardia bombarda]
QFAICDSDLESGPHFFRKPPSIAVIPPPTENMAASSEEMEIDKDEKETDKDDPTLLLRITVLKQPWADARIYRALGKHLGLFPKQAPVQPLMVQIFEEGATMVRAPESEWQTSGYARNPVQFFGDLQARAALTIWKDARQTEFTGLLLILRAGPGRIKWIETPRLPGNTDEHGPLAHAIDAFIKASENKIDWRLLAEWVILGGLDEVPVDELARPKFPAKDIRMTLHKLAIYTEVDELADLLKTMVLEESKEAEQGRRNRAAKAKERRMKGTAKKRAAKKRAAKSRANLSVDGNHTDNYRAAERSKIDDNQVKGQSIVLANRGKE